MSALFTSDQAIAWSGGRPSGTLPAAFEGVSTDSRTVKPGELFVALRGESFDGHAFLAAAAAAGADAAVVAEGATLPEQARGLPQLVVPDTLLALGALALGYRRTLNPVVVAVTGSVGKTSTKELLAAALSPLGPVLKTEGSLNNEIGLPQTLFRLRPEHRAAVLELGMNHLGEIARLTAIAEPSLGVVLNVRGVHLEHLHTLDNVAKAKGELFRGLPPRGVAIANAGDPLVMAQVREAGRSRETGLPVVTFGEGEADVQLLSVNDQGLRGVEFAATFVWPSSGSGRRAAPIPTRSASRSGSPCSGPTTR